MTDDATTPKTSLSRQNSLSKHQEKTQNTPINTLYTMRRIVFALIALSLLLSLAFANTVAEFVEEEIMSDAGLARGATVEATTTVNVRAGPCTNYRIVRRLSPGQTAEFTGQVRDECGYQWYSINGGWVVSKFVREVTRNEHPNNGRNTGGISVGQLRAIMPALSVAKANEYINPLNAAMNWGGITTCLRRSAFLAQIAEESGQLQWWVEFGSGAEYNGRRDLGNIYPGDGPRYKGRGPIQLTGRNNYRAAGQAIGVNLESNPTLAASPQYGFKIAVWFWNTRGLNQFADWGNLAGFNAITLRINGGYNGAAVRDQFWYTARRVLGC
jgi:predicted chitinase/uncharacterized protein YraI